jgi:HK97 family phage major capsid protein
MPEKQTSAALKVGRQRRFASFDARAAASENVQRAATPLDSESRTLALSFSSETPVERWFGNEVLSHSAEAADFSRLNDGAPLLFGHDTRDVIGVVEKAWIEGGRGMAIVRFAKTARGDEMMGMVADGVLRNVSFAYSVERYIAESEDDPSEGVSDDATYTATRWLAYEISLVSVPADASVGVGRADAGDSKDVPVERRQPAAKAETQTKGNDMPPNGNSGEGGSPAVDVKVIEGARADAVQAERGRVSEIETMGQRLSQGDLARKLIQEGKSVEEARAAFIDAVGAKQKPVAMGDSAGDIDMTDSEKRSFSIVKAIRAALSRDWTGAGFEREVSLALQKRAGREAQSEHSFFIPTNLPFRVAGLESRAPYAVGASATGGALVATNLLASSFIEALRNQAIVGRLGARFLTGLQGSVAIPRRTATTPVYWVAESGAITEGESTFDQVTLSPKTAGALSKMSRKSLLQTSPDIEQLTRDDLLASMALGIDLAAISGSGAGNQPTGVVNQAGIGSVVGGVNGANVTFDNIIQLQTLPDVANAPQQNLAFALNSKTVGYLSSLKSSTGAYLWTPNGNGGVAGATADMLKGYPYGKSNQLRSNLTKGTSAGICSEIVYGNWAELLIGEWGVLEIMANPYDSAGFANGDVLIRAFQTIDVGVRHAASFSAMSDALTPGF